MSGCVGGCLAFVGVMRMFDVLDQGINYLKRDVEPQPNDTKCKQICRVAANAFHIIGLFCAAIGMITMGYTLVTLGPQLAFLGALNQAIGASIPYFVGALATLSANLMIRQVAR